MTGEPGQHVIAQMVDVLAAFAGTHGRTVVPLMRPQIGVQVDPEVRGGYPAVEGTRVLYDLVAGLLMDGMDPADVSAFYPSVEPSAAVGALAFAEYVDAHNGAVAA